MLIRIWKVFRFSFSYVFFFFFLAFPHIFFLYLLLNHSWSEFSGLELPYQISANWFSCRIRPYLEASDWFLCGFYQRRPTVIIATVLRHLKVSWSAICFLCGKAEVILFTVSQISQGPEVTLPRQYARPCLSLWHLLSDHVDLMKSFHKIDMIVEIPNEEAVSFVL